MQVPHVVELLANRPALQFKHCCGLVMRGVCENFPEGHEVHVRDPRGAKKPSAQHTADPGAAVTAAFGHG
jgi:hypothetical protein